MSKNKLIRVVMANAFEIHFPIQILYRSLYYNGMIIDIIGFGFGFLAFNRHRL